MSHLKLTQQAGPGQTDTRGQYCNRIQRPLPLFPCQTTVSLKQTQTLQRTGETGKIIQVTEMNRNEMIKFS